MMAESAWDRHFWQEWMIEDFLERQDFTMCVALPGRVVRVDGHMAEVDFSGNTVTAEPGLVKVRPGDRVLVHAGCIIQTMTEKDADELEELFREVEDIDV